MWIMGCGEDQRLGLMQKDQAEKGIEAEVRVRIWVRVVLGFHRCGELVELCAV
jgi:hypothetical protein